MYCGGGGLPKHYNPLQFRLSIGETRVPGSRLCAVTSYSSSAHACTLSLHVGVSNKSCGWGLIVLSYEVPRAKLSLPLITLTTPSRSQPGEPPSPSTCLKDCVLSIQICITFAILYFIDCPTTFFTHGAAYPVSYHSLLTHSRHSLISLLITSHLAIISILVHILPLYLYVSRDSSFPPYNSLSSARPHARHTPGAPSNGGADGIHALHLTPAFQHTFDCFSAIERLYH